MPSRPPCTDPGRARGRVARGIAAVLVAIAAIPAYAAGDRLRLPDTTLDRDGPVPVVYALDRPVTGTVRLHLTWTDALGRRVADRQIVADLHDTTRLVFPLDLGRALAMANHLHVDRYRPDGGLAGGADTDFIARPPGGRWRDYVVTMWQDYPSQALPILRRLGINAGKHSGRSTHRPQALIDHDMRWYVESLAPGFYAPYHRYHPDRPKNWLFQRARQRYRQMHGQRSALKREPSLVDPAWRRKVRERARTAAKRNAPYRPYFYSLSDEPGIAELGAPWDFDFSAASLAGFRNWLQHQYPDLAALNAEWGSDYGHWHEVMPPTTDEALARPGHNFAPWADFKTWMDASFADALRVGVEGVHAGDPGALVGIGGAQMPGWGGYDYARLTRVLGALEPYDIGRNVDIVASLAPSLPMVTTSFAGGPEERHRLWHELLHGTRGLIIWDGNHRYVRDDGTPGARARGAAPLYHELRAGIGALIINSRPAPPTVAIHYSQPSLRIAWLLRQRDAYTHWTIPSPGYARAHDPFLRLRESWCDLLADAGLAYRFVAYDRLADTDLHAEGVRVLVLPDSLALSAHAAHAIRRFVATGGIVIASGMPGIYDGHGRRRARSPLADLFPAPALGRWLISRLFGSRPTIGIRAHGRGTAIRMAGIRDYLAQRLRGEQQPVLRPFRQQLASLGVHPALAVDDGAGRPLAGLDIRRYSNGDVDLVTLQTNPQLRVNELGPPDFRDNARFYRPRTAHVHWPQPRYVYDVRRGQALGRLRDVAIRVDAYEPTILATSAAPLPAMRITAARRVRLGDTLRLGIDTPGSPADRAVFHVEVIDPSGHAVAAYSGNVIARHGSGVKRIPLAVNDPAGVWQVRIHDLLSGARVVRDIRATPAVEDTVRARTTD